MEPEAQWIGLIVVWAARLRVLIWWVYNYEYNQATVNNYSETKKTGHPGTDLAKNLCLPKISPRTHVELNKCLFYAYFKRDVKQENDSHAIQ